MLFPNFPNKYNLESIIRPQDMLAIRKLQGKISNAPSPDGVLICMRSDLPRRLYWKSPIKKIGRTLGDIYIVKHTQGKVGVLTNFGIGAPALTACVEELIAWGVKRFILLSWGGALQKNLQSGDIILTDRAIRDEGVSHHYQPPEKYSYADPSLKYRLEETLNSNEVKFLSGDTWTTDAPYCETKDEVLYYQSEDVQVVEMEIASLFALAKKRNVKAASIVIVSDSLANLKWQPPMNMQSIDHSFKTCYLLSIKALCEDV